MIVLFCSKKGFNVTSFGTGNAVKLPGSAPDKPNIYDFSVTYDEMYRDLIKKDYELYPLYVTNIDDFKKCPYLRFSMGGEIYIF